MPDQGCCSTDVCRESRQSGSVGKLTLETILLPAVWAKLPVLLDDYVRCQMSAPWLAREVGKDGYKQTSSLTLAIFINSINLLTYRREQTV